MKLLNRLASLTQPIEQLALNQPQEPPMDLESFIAETLVQISKGVSAANDALASERKNPDGSALPNALFIAARWR